MGARVLISETWYYHWLDFTPPRPQIAAAPVEDFVTAAHGSRFILGGEAEAMPPPFSPR